MGVLKFVVYNRLPMANVHLSRLPFWRFRFRRDLDQDEYAFGSDPHDSDSINLTKPFFIAI